MMSDEIDFEEQIRLEALEKEKAANKRTRIDEDGTEYEWDETKRAWFPRIDNNFIAEYQMNYGVSENADAKASETKENPESSESYRQYCIDYWKQYYANEKNDQTKESGDGNKDDEVDDQTLQAWADYYNSKEYREWYEKAYGTHQAQAEQPAQEETSTEKVSDDTNKEANEEKDASKIKKRKREPPKWFEMDNEKNNHVYVQNLPSDTTDEEFKELMTKVGLIMYDPLTRKPKLKLYREQDGTLKGDGRCCYIKSESVDLALQILDGYNFKGNILTVERAHFELKGEFNPNKRRKLTKSEKKKAQLQQEKLFAWLPEKSKFIRSNRERVMVMKGVFKLEDFNNPEYYELLRNRVRQECSQFGGVKKITIFDHNKDGVIKVLFTNPEEVDAAVPYLNGRIFYGRVITTEVWDGRSRYDVKETAEDFSKRDEQWANFLSAGSDANESAPAGEAEVPRTQDTAVTGSGNSSAETNVVNTSTGEVDSVISLDNESSAVQQEANLGSTNSETTADSDVNEEELPAQE